MHRTLTGRVTLILLGATVITTGLVLLIEIVFHTDSASLAGHDAETFMLLGIVGMQLAVFTTLWLLFRRFMVEPAKKLLASMRRVGEGDLGERVHLTSPQEFAELGEQFNAMLRRVENANNEVEAFYTESMARVDRLATVGELTTALSHEIRNPLAGLMGAIRILHEEVADEEHREILGEMRSTLGRLSKTTDELLSYGRMPQARMADHDINRCVRSVLSFVEMQRTASESVVIERDLEDTLPLVRVDSQQLQQALLNLCLNAVQAMPGGGTLQVSTSRLGDGEDRLLIRLRDTGVGIPEDAMALVFEPFHTTRDKGTGLGLTITKRIVEGFGGELELQSVVGEGTTATINLPLDPRLREASTEEADCGSDPRMRAHAGGGA